jgi:hypothetical protein
MRNNIVTICILLLYQDYALVGVNERDGDNFTGHYDQT